MFNGTKVVRGLCDKCDHRENRLYSLALQLLGSVVLEEGNTQQWWAAMDAATVRRTKDCLRINCDCETVTLCRECLAGLLAQLTSVSHPVGVLPGPEEVEDFVNELKKEDARDAKTED